MSDFEDFKFDDRVNTVINKFLSSIFKLNIESNDIEIETVKIIKSYKSLEFEISLNNFNIVNCELPYTVDCDIDNIDKYIYEETEKVRQHILNADLLVKLNEELDLKIMECNILKEKIKRVSNGENVET